MRSSTSGSLALFALLLAQAPLLGQGGFSIGGQSGGSGGGLGGFEPGPEMVPPGPCALFEGGELATLGVPQALSEFGRVVAVKGDLAVVGAPTDEEFQGGAVFVFRRIGIDWVQEEKLSSTTPYDQGLFGYAVDVDVVTGRETIVVGAPNEGTFFSLHGAVHIFENLGSSTQPDWQPTGYLQSQGDDHGVSVSLDGTRLAVGQNIAVPPAGIGYVHVYERDLSCNLTCAQCGGWCYKQLLSPASGAAIGQSLDLDGDLLVTGGSAFVEYESVSVFRFHGLWLEEAQLVPPDPQFNEEFGFQVAVHDNEIVVTSPFRWVNNAPDGTAWVFRYDTVNAWNAPRELPLPEATISVDEFGYALAFQEGLIAIGAPESSPSGPGTGAVFLFRRNGASWEYDQRLVQSDVDDRDRFGLALDFDGQTLIASAGEDGSSGEGSAYAFAESCNKTPGTISRSSVDSFGAQSDLDTSDVRVSGDGRWVAFHSNATNLVPGDTNNARDIFVHDLLTGLTERISVDSSGAQANSGSSRPDISGDGRFVVFRSGASNLVAGDVNGLTDIFRHDRGTGQTIRVSVDSAGVQANGGSNRPHISSAGNLIAFDSTATNLVPGDFNAEADVFVHDVLTGLTVRASIGSLGEEGDGESRSGQLADGYVVFESSATTLVPGDVNGFKDAFVHDLQSGQTSLVSLSSSGVQGDGSSQDPTISRNGRMVAFRSKAQNLVAGDNGKQDIFVRDLQLQTTWRVSESPAGQAANQTSTGPRINASGDRVVFHTKATNLVSGTTSDHNDIYVKDLLTGEVTLVSVGAFDGNGSSRSGDISDAGETVVFWSDATNLVSQDTNGVSDAFAVEMQP